MYKKSYGKESKLSYLGHALVENRNGLIAAAMVTTADGYAERDAALLMLHERQKDRSRRITVGADKAYDTKDFVRTARELNVTPHVTKNEKGRRSNLDRRTTRHAGYAISLSRRWLVEKGFGWLKQTGPLRQVKLRGLEKVDWLFVFSCAAHNLLRLPRLIAQSQPARLKEQCALSTVEDQKWPSERHEKPRKHSQNARSQPIQPTVRHKSPINPHRSTEFQQVPRESLHKFCILCLID